MDRVVSSYTPTIRALRYSRQRAQAGTGADSRSLIVAMPTTPGMPSGALPGVIAEVNRVRNLVPTRAAVLAQLPGCAVAHFACHGATDSANPSRSLLVLHDHQADPLTVASLAPVNLARAQLAYLSARQTASVPANGLADEAIQLVTAFQLVGFPSVVGTLWEIHERAATTIAGEFYAGLQTSHGTLDTSNAARVLHRAVRGQRDRYPRTPFLWAGYLHAGA